MENEMVQGGGGVGGWLRGVMVWLGLGGVLEGRDEFRLYM